MDQEAAKQAIVPIIQQAIDAWYWKGFLTGVGGTLIIVWVGYAITQFSVGFYEGWKRSRARRQS